MRREFAQWVEEFGERESRLIFITGDLGYNALESVREKMGDRFVNAGVSEQNMISMAAAMARQGLHPLCYSIAPFVAFRPYEQTRLDVALHDLPVKLVGNGGGYGYGIMGASHHALEDLAVLSCLPNFCCIAPLCNADVPSAAEALFKHTGPGYLRLGLGHWQDSWGELPAFKPIRQLPKAKPGTAKLTVAGIGPVLLNAMSTLPQSEDIDVFAISQLPIAQWDDAFLDSVRASGQLLVIEEHTARGGLGEHVAMALAQAGIPYKLHHRHAVGYPTGRYGSQDWHQKQSGLDSESLHTTISRLIG